ncbi:MAG: hypothetical protein NW237_04840 [Cyanobacteriota bacterium]|nr:hypothetical protein [Cyanobacteriota bacterium]
MMNSNMTPDMIRSFWSLVAELGKPELLAKRDDDLVHVILDACQQEHSLKMMDPHQLNGYISTRLPLIRDMVLG